jgi:hypothetical protein
VPSEARKRGSGGGSPRKYDDLLAGPSDLLDKLIDLLRSGDQAVPVNSEPSEARKRGFGGGSPRKYDGRKRRGMKEEVPGYEEYYDELQTANCCN